MYLLWTARAAAVPLLLTFLLTGGCAGTAPSAGNPSESRIGSRLQPSPLRFMILNAEGEDVNNRYHSTLAVGVYPELLRTAIRWGPLPAPFIAGLM